MVNSQPVWIWVGRVTLLVLQVYFRDHSGSLDNPNMDTQSNIMSYHSDFLIGSIGYTSLSRRWVSYGRRRRCLVWLETEMSRMAGDDSWLWYRLMAFSHTCSFIYIGLVALLDRTQLSFSSITISTGYEPGARYNLYNEYSIHIPRSRASKTLNHRWPSLFVTVATAAHQHTKTQHHHHCHHLLHTSTMSTFMMYTETFKNDYRVIAIPTSFSSIPFPAMSIS